MYKKKDKKINANSLLEYVCWLADANKIYDVALGTYDLDLVALVAKQTQKVFYFKKNYIQNNLLKLKDPKEYIPYLESLMKI